MHDSFWPRVLAIVLLTVTMTATVYRLKDAGDLPKPPGPEILVPPGDPLRMEQRRCQQMGEAAVSDPGCLATWAESRDRFLNRVPAPVAPPASEGQ